QGLVSPLVRVLLGSMLGLALVGAGLLLQRRPELQRRSATDQPSLVPTTLAAAGLCVGFAAIYAAYALYDLLPPLAAFIALGVTALAGFAMALLFGRMVALLGLLGAIVNPLLVSSTSPSAIGLFIYLFLVALSATALSGYRQWWWLSRATTVGIALWIGLWTISQWQPSDVWPIGLFLIGYGIAIQLLIPRGSHTSGLQRLVARRSMDAGDSTVVAAGLLAIASAFVLLRISDYAWSAFGVLAAILLLTLWGGARRPGTDMLAMPAAILLPIVFASWQLPLAPESWVPFLNGDGRVIGYFSTTLIPPDYEDFASLATVYTLAFAAAAYAIGRRAPVPAVWASAASLATLSVALTAYWRLSGFSPNLLWGLLLAGIAATAVEACRRSQPLGDGQAAAAVYAAAAVAGLSFAIVALLRDSWLTVGLAMQVPALAWLEARFRFTALRLLAGAMTAVIAIRLMLNPFALDYALGATPVFNWLLYGYGLPATACLLAAWKMRKAPRGIDGVATGVEIVGYAFAVILVGLQIRHIIGGGTLTASYGLLEQGLQSAAGLALGWWLLRRSRLAPRPALTWAWRGLLTLASVNTLFLPVLASNPLWTGAKVGPWPIIDLLLLAYGVPALLAVLLYAAFDDTREAKLKRLSGIAALGLCFLYLTLELRHLFHGPVIAMWQPTEDGEWYAYSALWLGYCFALLLAGIRFGVRGLRYAALALALIVISKLFLFDMSNLTGLYRAGSFVGMGLALMGISYMYRRFVRSA
ncbi:MAG: DUF2339 domain-containing protein, partial [Ferrovibrio sp.]